jgi:hypothetical protein
MSRHIACANNSENGNNGIKVVSTFDASKNKGASGSLASGGPPLVKLSEQMEKYILLKARKKPTRSQPETENRSFTKKPTQQCQKIPAKYVSKLIQYKNAT